MVSQKSSSSSYNVLSLRFEVVILEGETFRILFHRTGLTILNNSTSYESFEQFFNSNSEAYRQNFKIHYMAQNFGTFAKNISTLEITLPTPNFIYPSRLFFCVF